MMLLRAWLFAAILAVWPAQLLAETEGPSAVEQQAGEAMILPVDADPLIVETEAGEQRFSIEIADTGATRSAGLMFRQEMDDDHGMLFVFEQTNPVGFWMKNTPMALDLVFIDEDGLITAILPGEPFSTDTISPGVPVRFVLELKQGTAQKAGIGQGDRIYHPRIDAVADRE